MSAEPAVAIRRIHLTRFKRFLDERFEFRPLTVLTGLNGAGKSSLLQALLLSMEAVRVGHNGFISVNSAWSLALGQAHELFTFGAAESSIEIKVEGAASPAVEISLERCHDDPLRLRVHLRPEGVASLLDVTSVAYLCAERLGPRSSLPVAPQGRGGTTVGMQGEYCAHFLHTHESMTVRASRRHPGTTAGEDDAPSTLLKQTEFWMGELAPGLQIRVEPLDAALQAALRFMSGGGVRAEFVRPANMGFGVSYALPIIVQGLALRPGGLLVVENPEAHLHPAGQSLMGRFLGILAADGVQVMVETHSDHVLNGICLATVEDAAKHPLRREDVGIYSFTSAPKEGAGGSAAQFIEISKKGSFTQNPTWFFDQAEKDLRAILRARTPPAQQLRDRAEEQ